MINVADEELQKKMMEYRMLELNYHALIQRREELLGRLMEVKGTMDSIEELGKSEGSEVFLPLGAGVLVPVKFDSKKKLIIGVGSDIVLEKDIDGIKKDLEKRMELFDQAAQATEKDLVMIQQKMASLEPELITKAK